jgi:hypothetical protein
MVDDEILEPEEEEEGGGEGSGEAGEPEGERGGTLADLDIYDTLRFMIGILNQAAWMHLGLVVPPGAGEARPDLAQARVAIDALEALAGLLRADSDGEERREMESMLANLRINYVKRVE